jgi:hypothetical protein
MGKPASTGVCVGIEKGIVLAAGDPGFRAELLQDRDQAMVRRGIQLDERQRGILRAVPERQLRAVIDSVDLAQDNLRRRRFLKSVMAASVGLMATAGCGDSEGPSGDGGNFDGQPSDAEIDVPDGSGFMPDMGVRPDTVNLGNFGASCQDANDCHGITRCAEIDGQKICTIWCTPDDFATPLVNEDSCPTGYHCKNKAGDTMPELYLCAPKRDAG